MDHQLSADRLTAWIKIRANVAGRPRYALIDTVRGVAILLMFVYHFSWDLTFFGFAQFQIFSNPYWIWFAKIIASIILFVMGVSQVMARRRGLTPKAYFRRLGFIAACAGVVSLTTYQIDPATYVFFGILHHVALASVILAALIYLPTSALIVLATLCVVAPNFLASPIFSADWLLWTGLSTSQPVSVDFVPLVPWFSVLLLGVVLGRLMFSDGTVPKLFMWQPSNPLTRLVCLAGRYSLLLYMIHQPFLFGGLYLFVALFGAGHVT